MPNYKFFKKKEKSNKELSGAPSYAQWIESINEDNYWIVLNVHLLNVDAVATDGKLNDRVNAFKACLQTFGTHSNVLNNRGKAQNHIFHGHVTGSSGATYVLEWTVIDPNKRIMALVGFDKHENYKFKTEPLTADEKSAILACGRNSALIDRIESMIDNTKEKISRTMDNYKNCQPL